MGVGQYLRLVGTATALSVLAIAAVAGPGVATAATPQIGVWQAPVLIFPDAYVVDGESMQAISCASAGNCSAVGTFDGTLERNGSAVDEGFVISETDGVWGTAQEVADDNDDLYRFSAISCSSSGNCAVVGVNSQSDAGFVMDETAGAWGAPQDIVGSTSLSSVSCPSDGDCMAAGTYGGQAVAVSESAGTWGTAEVLPGSLNSGAGLTSISCSSAGNCSAGGDYTDSSGSYALVADETDGTWGSVQDLNGSFNNDADDASDIVSVSCSSAGNCSAGGYYTSPAPSIGYYTYAFVVSEVDGTWGDVVEVAQPLDAYDSGLASISCPSDGNCSAGGYYAYGADDVQAMVVEETDGVWQPAQEVAGSLNVDDYGQITSISCASTGNCSAAGYYSTETASLGLVVTETDGSWDSGQDVAASPLSSISCPSVENCVAVGDIDNVGDPIQSFVVAEIPEDAQTITFAAPSEGTVGSSAVLTASASSGLAVVLSLDASTTNDACTLLDGDTVVYQQAGSCVLDANQAGNADFAAAPQVQQTITISIGNAAQTITFTAPLQGTVNSSAVLAPSASSGLAVALSVDRSTTNDACTLDGDTVMYQHAGSCVLDANQAGNVDFAAAPQVQQTINIGGNAGPTLVVHALPVEVTPPVISGALITGRQLTCSTGRWANDPTGFAFQWIRNGTTLDGATDDTYALGTLDEGTTLTCAVTAMNAAGSRSADSAQVKVPIPFVALCPGATGSLSGTTIGLIHLGMTRSQARRAYVHHSNRGKQYEDFFCLTPIGVRVGYASPKLLQHLSRREQAELNGTVVWSSTSNPYYSLDGIRPGESIATASRALGTEPPFHIGLNYWYLARKANLTAVLKVRDGEVQELGIAVNALTTTRSLQNILMHSFY